MGDLADLVMEQVLKEEPIQPGETTKTIDEAVDKAEAKEDATSSNLPIVNPPPEEPAEKKEEKAEEKKQEKSEPPPPAPKVEEKTKPPPEPEYEVTIDGKKEKKPLKDLIAGYQIREAGDRRMAEAHQIREKAEAREKEISAKEATVNRAMEQLFRDPMRTLEELFSGRIGDPHVAREVVRKKTADWLAQELEYETLPPEQKKAMYEARQFELEKKRIREEREQLDQERSQIQQQTIQRQLIEALDGAVKASGLPDYEGTRRAIAAEMLKLPETLPPNERALQAAQRLKANGEQAVLNDSIKLLKENPVEKIAELAPEVLEKIRQWEIERINKEKALKQQSIAAAKTSKDSIKQPRRGPAQKVVSSTGFRDFFESR